MKRYDFPFERNVLGTVWRVQECVACPSDGIAFAISLTVFPSFHCSFILVA